jgi:hypothetical protein
MQAASRSLMFMQIVLSLHPAQIACHHILLTGWMAQGWLTSESNARKTRCMVYRQDVGTVCLLYSKGFGLFDQVGPQKWYYILKRMSLLGNSRI